MYLCEYCQKGQTEMCKYFLENFLEDGGAVVRCPEFQEERHEQSESIWDVGRFDAKQQDGPEAETEAEKAGETTPPSCFA